MARGTLIALVGIDGSGKSTQAARLAATLRAQGERARAFENPGGRPVLDAVARRLGRADGGELLGASGRVATELVVRSVALARAITWARLTGGTAVLDRYAICQVATMRARGDQGQRLAAGWARRFPDPDQLLWLAVTPSIAQKRDTERLEWLDAFDAAYRELVATTATVIDADRDPAAVQHAIAGRTMRAGTSPGAAWDDLAPAGGPSANDETRPAG